MSSSTSMTGLDLPDDADRTVATHVLEGVVTGHYRTTNAGFTSTAGWLAPDEVQPLYKLYRAGMVTYEPTVHLTAEGVGLARSLGVEVDQ